jgi:hypothetical protein
MQNKVRTVAAVTMLFISSAIAQEHLAIRILPLTPQLPSAPAGYEWKSCIKDQVSMLVPSGWIVQSRNGQNVVQCAASANFGASPNDFSGLEVGIFMKPSGANVQTPEQYSTQSIQNLRSKASTFSQWTSQDSQFSYRNADVVIGGDSATMSWALNKSTGSVVHLILTSPSSTWSEVRAAGSVMIQYVAVSTKL